MRRGKLGIERRICHPQDPLYDHASLRCRPLEENTRPNVRESRIGAENSEAENISQLVALQGEINELKGMLRELMQRGKQ